MRNLTCIVCPVGCSLTVEENPAAGAAADDAAGFPALTVTGNRCPRGAVYAREEVRAPKRTVTATCAIAGGTAERGLYAPRRVPVKTTAPCPRERIPALLAAIHQTTVTLPVKAGDVIIAGWQGAGFDVIAVRTVS